MAAGRSEKEDITWIDRADRSLCGRRRVAVYVLLFQLVMFVYWPSLGGGFLYDEFPSIVDNPDLRSGPSCVFRDHETSLSFDRRPVGGLLTWVNFQFSGLRPVGYRLVNLVLHIAVAIAIAELITLAGKRLEIGRVRLFAMASGIVWALHPLNTSAVAYIYQRMEQLMALFFVLALILLLLAGGARGRPGRAYLVGAWVCAVLSLMSKEVALLLPLVLVVFDRVISHSTWRDLFRSPSRRVFYGTMFAAWAMAGLWFVGGSRVAELGVDDPLSNPGGYFTVQCREVLNYLKLVFYPDPLTFFRAPRYVNGISQWVPHLIALATIAAGLVMGAMRRNWVWLAGSVFVAVLAPTSSVIPVPLEPAAEFRMYLPSAAVILLSFALAAKLAARLEVPGEAVLLGFVAASLVLAVMSRERATVFGSRMAVWEDTVEKEPWNAKAWANLASAYIDGGRPELAERPAQVIEDLQSKGVAPPQWAEQIRGSAAMARGDSKGAVMHFRNALSVAPEKIDLMVGLGEALVLNGEHSEAIEMLDHAIGSGGGNPLRALRAKVRALESLGRNDEAKKIRVGLGEMALTEH